MANVQFAYLSLFDDYAEVDSNYCDKLGASNATARHGSEGTHEASRTDAAHASPQQDRECAGCGMGCGGVYRTNRRGSDRLGV